jgi:hypothetical protein
MAADYIRAVPAIDLTVCREIVEYLRPRDRGHQTAVLAALVYDGDLTNEQAKDLLFMIIMDEVGIPVRRRADN